MKRDSGVVFLKGKRPGESVLRKLGAVRRRHPGTRPSGAVKRRRRGRAMNKPRCAHGIPMLISYDGGPQTPATKICGARLKSRRGVLVCPVHGTAWRAS